MNPSRTFILRPVATSLLTAAVLLAGFAGYSQLPISALPQAHYPPIEILRYSTLCGARASLRPPARPQPAELHQLLRGLPDPAPVPPRASDRRRRAGGAGRHQRRG